jgi:hypothetical protein
MRISTSNPQTKAINQKRGPTTGNMDMGNKRSTFMKEKASSGNEKSALADMVTNAVANRGRGMKPFIDPTVEGLHADTNVGPKNNTTANGAKLPAKYKSPKK